jgi:hypothetical protein
MGRDPAGQAHRRDGRTETVTEVLQRESVRFTGDVAGPTQRLTIAELRALLVAE